MYSFTIKKEYFRFLWEKVLLVIIFGGAIFTKNFISPGVSVSDLLISLVVLVVFFGIITKVLRFYIPKNGIWIFLITLWILVSSAYLIHSGAQAFDAKEFLKSFLKFSLYATGYVSVYCFFLNIKNKDLISKVLLNILVINSLIAIYIYIAMSTSWGLPYEFFWTGIAANSAGYFGGIGFIRARGIFSEPAVFGTFQAMGFAYLLLGHHLHKKEWLKCGIIIVSIVLTVSLSTYFLFAVILLLYCIRSYRIQLRSIAETTKYVVLILSIITSVYFLTPLNEYIDQGIIVRLSNVINGYDTSGNTRLVGGWELALAETSVNPITGSGLGNLDLVYSNFGNSLLSTDKTGRVHNLFAFMLGSTGWVGLTFFALLISGTIKKNPKFGLFLCAVMFVMGGFLELTFWVFLALYYLPNRSVKTQSKVIPLTGETITQ